MRFEVMMPRTRRSSLQLARQPLDLRRELIEQHAADAARADQADRDRVRRQVEARMHRAQRARRVLAVDHDRDVALGRALRDRAHVDRRRCRARRRLSRRRRARPPCRRRRRRGCCSRASTSTLWIWPCAQLAVERLRARPPRRAPPRASGIAKQIECSELPCEIRMTEMP